MTKPGKISSAKNCYGEKMRGSGPVVSTSLNSKLSNLNFQHVDVLYKENLNQFKQEEFDTSTGQSQFSLSI